MSGWRPFKDLMDDTTFMSVSLFLINEKSAMKYPSADIVKHTFLFFFTAADFFDARRMFALFETERPPFWGDRLV